MVIPTPTLCYEVVTYKVKDQQQADSARAFARSLLKHFPGFIDWIALSGIDTPTKRVDLVLWSSHEEALSAAKLMESQAEFASFRDSVSGLDSMGHYITPLVQAPVIGKGRGIEMGRFKLKPNVDKGEMRKRYNRKIAEHLSHQPGWKSQHRQSDVYRSRLCR